MTARKSKKGLLARRFSSRRSSSNYPDSSASYHHSSTAHRNSMAGKSFPRFTRLKSSLSLRRSSVSSNDSDGAAIDPVTQSLAIRAAEQEKTNFRESLPGSLLRAHDARDCVAPFQRDEIVLGPKLGSGEFSNVYEVKSFQCRPDFTEVAECDDEEMEVRLHLQKHEKYRETNNSRYALKRMKEDYYRNHEPDCYIQAASDLALETEFLACLQHPNIMKLRGIAHLGADGFGEGPSGYFLIMDLLPETLDQRMRAWRMNTTQGRPKSSFRRRMSFIPDMTSKKKDIISETRRSETNVDKNNVTDERLDVALQISAALVYLHGHSVIFRDIKPTNIGFDVRGDVKIFDFGLARIMPENGDPNKDLFDMSGAGSPRYMAPECLSGKPYNMKADVFAFSMVFWEILSGQTPHMFVRRKHQLISYVVEENGRPDIDESWPGPIRGMLESSFDSEIVNRPNMTMWYDIICGALASLRGHSRGLNATHISRRRSVESFSNLLNAG